MPIPKEEIERQQRADAMKLKLSDLDHQFQTVKLGGGQARIDKEHSKGKLTARERLSLLMDAHEAVLEVGAFSGHGMYKEHGGCPGGGCVVVIGKVSGVRCIAVANDATVKAGAWFPITGKKHLRAQELAFEFHLPIVYLVDSAGVYLPMQDEIFPDKEHFGRIFRNNARLSAAGIPQLAAVMGSCVAGGAYLPIMSDESIIVQGTGSIFLAGPYLVKAAIGEDVGAEDLGGADMHGSISGVVDHVVQNDREALDLLRKLMAQRAGRPSPATTTVRPRPIQKAMKMPCFLSCPPLAEKPMKPGTFCPPWSTTATLPNSNAIMARPCCAQQRALTVGAWALSPTKEPW